MIHWRIFRIVFCCCFVNHLASNCVQRPSKPKRIYAFDVRPEFQIEILNGNDALFDVFLFILSSFCLRMKYECANIGRSITMRAPAHWIWDDCKHWMVWVPGSRTMKQVRIYSVHYLTHTHTHSRPTIDMRCHCYTNETVYRIQVQGNLWKRIEK